MYAFVGADEMGKRLIKLRGNRSQAEVAKCCSITPTALSNYERGDRIPRDDVKVRLANFYGVSLESIFFI